MPESPLNRAQDLLARAAMTQSIIDSITAPTEPVEAFDTMEVMALRAVLANETAMRDHHATLASIHANTATMYEERMLRVSDEIVKRLGEQGLNAGVGFTKGGPQ
jgi:hypothetical protein